MKNDQVMKEMIDKKFEQERDFITPNIFESDWITENLIYEISNGMNLLGYDVFGLTVLEIKDDKVECRQDLNIVSTDLNKLRQSVDKLKGSIEEDNKKMNKKFEMEGTGLDIEIYSLDLMDATEFPRVSIDMNVAFDEVIKIVSRAGSLYGMKDRRCRITVEEIKE